jgi:cytochrome P450
LDKKWWDAIKIAHDFADGYVAKALEFRRSFRKVASKMKELMGVVYCCTRWLRRLINPEDLFHEILHIFIAGHDSSAITITNAFFHLSRYPKAWTKLRAEILATSDEKLPHESLKKRKYWQ